MFRSNEHHIEKIINNAFERIKSVMGANAVVGTPITTADGVGIIPISRVALGFATGGGEYGSLTGGAGEYPFAGGSGAGLSVSPVGFLVSDGKCVKFVSLDDSFAFEKLLSIVPETIASLLKKDKEKK